MVVDPTVFDVTVPAGGRLQLDGVPGTHTTFAFVTEGEAAFGEARTAIPSGTLAVLGAGDTVEAVAGATGARLLLVAGAPIGEPVARRGPFVMNTDDEIRQAYADYRSGRLVGG